MQIAEPMTVLTDFFMGTAALIFSILLVKSAEGQRSRVWWAMALFLTATAAYSAGLYHGFNGFWPADTIQGLDTITILAMIGVSLCMLLGTIRSFVSKKLFDAALIVALVKACFFAVWNISHRSFLYIILDYAMALIAVVCLSLWRSKKSGSRWLLGGVAVSVFAAMTQQAGYSLATWFNYNDIYHIIQIIGLYLFYRGAVVLRDSSVAST